MTKQDAIRKHCLECAGDSRKEVTLCPLFDCPLWPWRTGTHTSSKTYVERVTRTLEGSPEEVAELGKLGVDVSRFIPFSAEKPQRAGRAEKNSVQLDQRMGESA
jgi:hypothetical protein